MADDLLHIEAQDDAVWERTTEAVGASRRVDPPVRVLCDECWAVLAHAGITKWGPLFTSTWETPPTDGLAALRRVARKTGGQSGRLAGTEGVMALLALPPEMAQEYPDLLVRCPDHGDAVLDRHEILRALRHGRKDAIKVKVAMPRRRYQPVRQ